MKYCPEIKFFLRVKVKKILLLPLAFEQIVYCEFDFVSCWLTHAQKRVWLLRLTLLYSDRHCVGCLQSARVLFSLPYLLKSLTVVSWDSLSHVCHTDNVITRLDQTSHVHVRYLSSHHCLRGWVTQDRSRSRTELSFLYLCLWVRIHTLLRMGNTPSEKIDVNFSKGINYVCDSSCGISVVYENTWLPRTTACMASARSRQGNGMTSLTQLLLLSADGWKWKEKKCSLPGHGYPCWLPARGKLIHQQSIQEVQILA